MNSERTNDEGRDIRWAAIQTDDAGGYADAIEDIYRDRLDAIVLRQSFPAGPAAHALRRIRDNDGIPWLRPNRTGPNADIRVLGIAATPSFENPQGPGTDTYFDNVEFYEQATDGLFEADFSVARCIEGLLGRISGGRPVERLVNTDGRVFAACSVRSLPEGQCIIVHNDYGHIELPIYADVVSALDRAITLSFFAVLQAPESGGRLFVHGVTDSDDVPRLPGGFPDGEAIRRRYKYHAFDLGAGDVIVFGAGKFYHHVEPVGGPRPRVTLGGFLALSSDRRKVLYWN